MHDNLQIVALICDFSGPSSTSVMLNQLEVETLFHEFGHALHSLLSRTVLDGLPLYSLGHCLSFIILMSFTL